MMRSIDLTNRLRSCYSLKTVICNRPRAKNFSTADGLVSVALNNPKKRNALSTAVLQSLHDRLLAAKADVSTRVLIIKASDDISAYNGVFCSGHDLKELIQQPGESKAEFQNRMEKLFTLCSAVMTELATFPVPTIAQVDGIATAAGCQLVASCDLAVATSTSRFATPGVHIGLFCSTPAVPLVRTVSKKHAMELLLTGDLISAQRAYEIGLINRVVQISQKKEKLYEDDPQQQRMAMSSLLDDEVKKLASSIGRKSNPCIQKGLETLRKQRELPLAEAYQVAEKTMVNNLLSEDAVEGIDAFLHKRTPQWSDKK
jgi:enoyl-CoA hydratase/carnithine racemase